MSALCSHTKVPTALFTLCDNIRRLCFQLITFLPVSRGNAVPATPSRHLILAELDWLLSPDRRSAPNRVLIQSS